MQKSLKVKDVMSTRLRTISSELTLSEVRKIFENSHFHHLPVLDQHKLIGIVSNKDLTKILEGIQLAKQYPDLDVEELHERMNVDKIMTRNPFTVPPDTPVDEVMEIFYKDIFHAIPVIDHGKLVGIVSHHDVMYYIT